ncbi:MAG: alpha/beta hydrolase [Nibricoccus sp.]
MSRVSHLVLLAVSLVATLSIRGAELIVINLWPDKIDPRPDEVANERIVAVHNPSLTVYAPAAPNGTAVVFCPGGGYHHLTIGENGGPETRFFTSLGVTVFILKYSVQTLHPAPLRDVLRAIRIVRSRAKEFGLKGDRIGVFGASAGGHLAACAATLWEIRLGGRLIPLMRRARVRILPCWSTPWSRWRNPMFIRARADTSSARNLLQM